MKEVSHSATERDQVYPQLDLLPGQYAHLFKGSMIDHVILTVSDFKRSVAFYAKAALKPLGITTLIDYEGKDGHPDLKGFGDGKRHFFWLKEGSPILRPFTWDL